jgi:hypothetical protein
MMMMVVVVIGTAAASPMNQNECTELILFIPFLAPTRAWGIHETSRFTSVS